MLRRKTSVLLMALILTLASLGLAGCRQGDSGATPTPAANATPQMQLIPMVGGGESSATSPLPTPGTGSSPIAP